jgi:putative methyltransferase (TIGR04325 family)
MLPAGQLLEYTIIENETVCREGRRLMSEDQRLTFRSNFPGLTESYDVVHCGSSLHYIEDWRAMLERFAAIKPAFMLFADLPAADNLGFVTRQFFHGRHIPVHFWNLREFIQAVEMLGYNLLFKARYRGSYLAVGETLPTEHFASPHRLEYCSQLVFRRVSTY